MAGNSRPRVVGYGGKFLDRLCRPRLSGFFRPMLGKCLYFDEGECRYFKPGDTIFMAGDSCNEVAVLEKGLVEITRPAGRGSRAFLRLCFESEIVGEEAMFDFHRPVPARAITATALTPVAAHVMSATDMRKFLDSEPGAWELLAEDLSARLSNADSVVTGLSCDPADQRLARLLCELVRHGGVVQADGGKKLPIDITQRRLASWIGASTETVERILRKWRAQHIISTGQRVVIVRNVARLESIGRIESASP